jgi:hypothetical protein
MSVHGGGSVLHREPERGQRWLIQVEGGEFQLVESERELAELLHMGRVSAATRVYEVGAGPHALGDIPRLAHFFPDAVASEPPPVRRDRRSPERALLSEELAVLNRPLEEEIEYYDELPPRRWPRRLGAALVLAVVALASYPLLASHAGRWRTSAETRLKQFLGPPKLAMEPAHQVAAAVPSPSASADVAKAPVKIAPVAPAPVAPPAAVLTAVTDIRGESTIVVAAGGQASEADATRSSHARRRHASRHHGSKR